MKTSTITLVVALILAMAASFLCGCIVTQRRYEKEFKGADTVYIDKWLPQPVEEPKDSTPLKPIIVYLPKPYPIHDTTEVHDTTTVQDSVLVEVPIVEKTYEGENYRAIVRGFQPELTSIWINERQTIIKVPVQKHWTLTVGPQAGVGFTPKGVQPYAGAGITFGYSF